ncbi:Hsp20/alpha crystallin family protein [Kribbella sp. NPDC055110]
MNPDLAQRPVPTKAVRWLPTDPFAHFEDIHRRMNQLKRQLTIAPVGTAWTPAVDIEETDDEYLVEVDLPGAGTDDVVLERNDRSLTVHGQIPDREHPGMLRQHTRHTGPLHHTIGLPGPVLGDKITASLTHGLLTIHAPKAHPGPAHRIHITDPAPPTTAPEPDQPRPTVRPHR